ncbi:MAG: histidine kinase, partial [Candidatus Omnitrophica bacterium CG11_big_fil_rev_8_21_14_0_20_64_10]
KQVFLNLIINAIDAMGEVPERKHTLTVTLLPTPEVLQVEVRDTGCGIPEKHRSALTTPFFTTKEKGSGLGLAIVRNILEGHHASLHIDSRVGEGSAFTLHLPRRQPGSLSRAA